ncbi:MAG TPA: pseudouridine synthase [Leptospiraceae bacterium]|nr:pseudouridine synthase [Leptospiraceae bacterium]HMZ61824.1 pseudouridine synthase [Leptospiraceae bacterium]HNF13058.1 pseudouridine synthase [Leptospiraceae bacterium]HNF25528.1 pseudouridine synthase [Leptospiraceae bacterium]HNM05724.1 pseudouridine synthase [Leptospiraceae bacterium]
MVFHKPFQVLSQFKEDALGKKTLKDFISIPERPKALGRLDFDSEGLLLLTNDFSFIRRYTDPEVIIEKEYLVQVEGIPDESSLIPIRKGINTQTAEYRPADFEILYDLKMPERNPPIRFRKTVPDTWIRITVREGQNRQIRKMTAFCGFPTLRLIRTRIGDITLGDLPSGRFKFIKRFDW